MVELLYSVAHSSLSLGMHGSILLSVFWVVCFEITQARGWTRSWNATLAVYICPDILSTHLGEWGGRKGERKGGREGREVEISPSRIYNWQNICTIITYIHNFTIPLKYVHKLLKVRNLSGDKALLRQVGRAG